MLPVPHRNGFPLVLEAWDLPLLKQAPPYLSNLLPIRCSLAAEASWLLPGEFLQMQAFLWLVLHSAMGLAGFSKQALRAASLPERLVLLFHSWGSNFPGEGENPRHHAPQLHLCTLLHQAGIASGARPVSLSRSGWSRPRSWTQSSSPGVWTSTDQLASALINIQPFNRKINYPPTARQNSCDKLSF